MEPQVSASEIAREKRKKVSEMKSSAVRSAENVEASWQRVKDEPAIVDLLLFIKTNKERNNRVALDGVGVSVVEDGNGHSSYEKTVYTQDERMMFLDRAKGIDEIESYLERMLKINS